MYGVNVMCFSGSMHTRHNTRTKDITAGYFSFISKLTSQEPSWSQETYHHQSQVGTIKLHLDG